MENVARVIHAPRSLIARCVMAVLCEGHVILDQGPMRLTADQLFYNLDSKLGTLFNATGAMEPSLYFTADKAESALKIKRRHDLATEDGALEIRRVAVDRVDHQVGHRLAVIVP